MITITEAAAKKIVELALAENKEPKIRIAVQGGGCSGFQYTITFDEPKDGDEFQEAFGAEVLIDPMSFMYLDGVEIDYVESLEDSGFKINNPNATGQCGCGHSFEA